MVGPVVPWMAWPLSTLGCNARGRNACRHWCDCRCKGSAYAIVNEPWVGQGGCHTVWKAVSTAFYQYFRMLSNFGISLTTLTSNAKKLSNFADKFDNFDNQSLTKFDNSLLKVWQLWHLNKEFYFLI